MFDLPFEEIAPMVGRSPATARQLASRARRRVRGADLRAPDADLSRQRKVVDAFFAAAHHGDLDALVAVLHPDVVLRSDGGAAHPEATAVIRGAAAVARRTLTVAQPSVPKRPVLVNGAAGAIATLNGELALVMGFTVAGGRITEIDAIFGPERLRHLDLSSLGS
jgi:RNA polymerase sigma-70 factor (ECF subfamily)